MARHRSMGRVLLGESMRIAAASAREQARAAGRALRDAERAARQEEKDRQQSYTAARALDAANANVDLEQAIAQVTHVLFASLIVQHGFTADMLKQTPTIAPFAPGRLAIPEAPPPPEDYEVPPLSMVGRLWSPAKRRHEQALVARQEQYEADVRAHAEREIQRQRAFDDARMAYDEHVAQVEADTAAQHAAVDDFFARYVAGEQEAVIAYMALVCEASPYPEKVQPRTKLAYIPPSKQLVIDCDVPTIDVIPDIGSYKYVKSRDEISTTPRPATQRKGLYVQLIAQMALRALHEGFTADWATQIDTIVFNGYTHAIDQGTGRPIHPCLITVRTTRDIFAGLDLHHVDPLACLKVLNASVSRSPAELLPVRPIVEFTMVDPRFIAQENVLAGLDQRPNLMDLTPGEFETLIANLFHAIGYETRLTQASRDGGVDCVAYDMDPIRGGKVVIQAKRYKHTVGVSAVRDLYGTVMNEGAIKGILITTSGYGKAAFEFAQNKPLSLFDGPRLLYLLKDKAGIDAKIEIPDDWRDPQEDGIRAQNAHDEQSASYGESR